MSETKSLSLRETADTTKRVSAPPAELAWLTKQRLYSNEGLKLY
jgi:hypothetical protein